MSFGIQVAEDGQDISTRQIKFSSGRKRLIVDLESDPRHFNVLTRSGGTALVNGPFVTQEETLLTINHKLGFAPLCLVYFYVVSRNGSTSDPAAGAYYRDYFAFEAPNIFVFDYITWEADRENFRLIHKLNNGNDTAYTSLADQYQLKIKYYITAIPTGFVSYRGANY